MTDKQIIIAKELVNSLSQRIKNLGENCIEQQKKNDKLKAQLQAKQQECEELKKQLMQKNEVDMFFNTPIKGWSNNPCEICSHKAENEQLKEELSAIQHNCNREGCKYYDDDTFKVFYECKAQKALQLSANSVTTKYCDLLKTLAEIKPILEFYANAKMGEEQPDRTYKIMLSGGYSMVYNPKPAREALRKINEVEDEENM